MKEEILKALSELNIYFEHTFEGHPTSTANYSNEYDNDLFYFSIELREKVQYISDVDYPDFLDLDLISFELTNLNGEEIDANLTEEEILNAINY